MSNGLGRFLEGVAPRRRRFERRQEPHHPCHRYAHWAREHRRRLAAHARGGILLRCRTRVISKAYDVKKSAYIGDKERRALRTTADQITSTTTAVRLSA